MERNQSFFNSLSIRIPLAVIGGIFYGILTYSIVILITLPSELAMGTSIVVLLFYLGSRFVILFSGVDTPYYSKKGKPSSKRFYENTSFPQTAQWVGKFYHYHDIVLFVFLTVTAIVFLTTLIIDGLGSRPIGDTIQSLLKAFIPLL